MLLLIAIPGGGEWIILLRLLEFIVFIFYINTLHKTFNAMSIENRKMNPAAVWWLLVPLFQYIWHFIVVNNMRESIKEEAQSNNILVNQQLSTYALGLATCVLSCISIIFGIFAEVPALICGIIYWSKIASYKNQILRHHVDSTSVSSESMSY